MDDDIIEDGMTEDQLRARLHKIYGKHGILNSMSMKNFRGLYPKRSIKIQNPLIISKDIFISNKEISNFRIMEEEDLDWMKD